MFHFWSFLAHSGHQRSLQGPNCTTKLYSSIVPIVQFIFWSLQRPLAARMGQKRQKWNICAAEVDQQILKRLLLQTGKLQFVRRPRAQPSQRGSNVNTWVPTQIEKSPKFRRSPAGIFKLNSDLYLLYEIYIVEINGEYLRVAWNVTIFCVLKSQKIKFSPDFRTLSR